MKLLLVKEVYIDAEVVEANGVNGGFNPSSGIILRTEDGRLFRHNDSGNLVPLTEIKETDIPEESNGPSI